MIGPFFFFFLTGAFVYNRRCKQEWLGSEHYVVYVNMWSPRVVLTSFVTCRMNIYFREK